MPKIGAGGYCWEHEQEDPAYNRKQDRSAVKDAEKKLRMLSSSMDNKLVDNTAAIEFQKLQNFFSDAAKDIAKNPVCWECGDIIPLKYYRAATAHILPKAIFRSVAAHPMNRLHLCAKNGCHDKTHRLDTFSKMKVFPEAVRRFSIVYPEVKEKHKLLQDFIQIINESNATA